MQIISEEIQSIIVLSSYLLIISNYFRLDYFCKTIPFLTSVPLRYLGISKLPYEYFFGGRNCLCHSFKI